MVRKSALVTRALQGAKRRFGVATHRKLPFTHNDLLTVITHLNNNPSHDFLLFATQLSTGTECLMHLGKLTWPDSVSLQDYRKVMMRHLVESTPDAILFWLPGHKADRFFKGNRLYVGASSVHTHTLLTRYITSRDRLFRVRPEPWLKADGTIPTRGWFIKRLHAFFPSAYAGQSMQAGGATALTEAGTSPHLIQAAGRWTSDTFNRYV